MPAEMPKTKSAAAHVRRFLNNTTTNGADEFSRFLTIWRLDLDEPSEQGWGRIWVGIWLADGGWRAWR
jgi:hypothetical protein